ncbi:MAG: LysR family transcriptional regulator [Silicimonas sp.]|nr:LysR family transcriptional regulator [Silicimonas sp.]
MTPRQLAQFLAVCRHGSMSAAARDLHIAQPALSKQMTMLEHSLDTQLFKRHSRGVSLTNAGALLRIEAAEIIRKIDTLKDNLHGKGALVSGEVNIAIITSLAPTIGVELYKRLEKDFPSIKLNIVAMPSDLVSTTLSQQEVDMAILPNAATDLPNVQSIPLLEEDFFLIAQPGTEPSTGTIAFSDIGARPLALPRADHDMRRRIEEVARSTGATLNVRYESENITLLGALIESGLACSIQPVSYWLRHISEGKLAARRIASPPIIRVHSLCWPADIALSPADEAVREIIVAEVGLMIASGKLSGRPPGKAG